MEPAVNAPDPPVTELLRRLRAGDAAAAEQLMPVIQGELHRIAEASFQGQREGHTLQPTALLNEAWMRLFAGQSQDWKDRTHFLSTAARAMRHVLVDYARARGRLKRGKRAEFDPEHLEALMGVFEERSIDVLSLDEALGRLTQFDARLAGVVELRFFGGLSVPEVAEALDVSVTTVERDWRLARAWLRKELPEPGT